MFHSCYLSYCGRCLANYQRQCDSYQVRFMALKPAALSPMYYENAAIYTSSLLDAYMDYKNVSPVFSSFQLLSLALNFVDLP